MCYEQLRPKVIVDYTREPFIFPAGNVRITLDRDIRTGLSDVDALNPDIITIPAGDAKMHFYSGRLQLELYLLLE